MSFFVYILQSNSGIFYTGQTNNLEKRIHEHTNKLKKSAKFIHNSKEDFKLVYQEQFNTRQESMNREKQIKGWSRAKKIALITNNLTDLINLSHSNIS